MAPTCNPHDLRGSDVRATTIVSETVADPVSANEGRTYTHEGKNNFRTHNVVVGGAPGAFGWKASHFTRGKDGEPSPIMPPLSADADKGDQDAVIFQPREAVGYDPFNDSLTGDVSPTMTRPSGGANRIPHVIEGAADAQVAPTVNGTQRQQIDGAMAVDSSVGIPRRLMPLETERLQGWPDGWTDVPKRDILRPSDAAAAGVIGEFHYDHPSDAKRYRAVGNGVAKPVAEWIAWRIRIAAAEAYLTLQSASPPAVESDV